MKKEVSFSPQWKKYGALLVFITLSLHYTAFSQTQLTITGTVIDSVDAGPLPGVSVLVEGTTLGSQTDRDGKYAILASKGSVLVFRFVGYNQKRMVVADQTVINVRLISLSVGLI